MHGFSDPSVKQAFERFPVSHCEPLLQLRRWVFEVGTELHATGGVQESLKWGELSYCPVKPRVGSPVRLGRFDDEHIALYLHCQTMLIEGFRRRFGDTLAYSKNRAVLLAIREPLPEGVCKFCIRAALSYRLLA